MINSKNISIVVQGAIDKELTPKCLKSIRKYLSKATIILSTWENSDIKYLDYDMLVESIDPGAEICDDVYNIRNNVNRQIVSTKNGLKIVKTNYAMKLRSDMKLKNTNFLKFFGKYDGFRNEICKIFKNRIIINNLYCADPVDTTFPLHISDWVQFGLIEDLLRLWDIPLQEEPEGSRYFFNKEKPTGDKNPTWLFRYIPEQYIWKSCLNKNNISTNINYYSDLNPENLKLTEISFSNNTVILDYKNYGIEFLKYDPYKWDYTKQMNYSKWLGLYIKYCNINYKKSLIEHFVSLFKHDIIKTYIENIWILRKMYRFFLCIQENGILYTACLLIKKIFKKLYKYIIINR
jgi:hypothetical protein